ncbi:MAG: adenosylcobinamide-GDP ribazoletransferase [Blautia sp.]|nr:adenosylcobinamide-GDP ribazoletransferase [Blautia sp.]MCM1200280.1 adenosylcobinamide-GDP ribazoletransferase [Bacteroides fragilis]
MFRWLNNRENAKYIFSLRVLYGVAVGAVMWAFYGLCRYFDFGWSCFALIGAAVPVVMSGGVYLSGFLNTSEVLAQRLDGKGKNPRNAGAETDRAGTEAGAAGAHTLIAAMTFYLLYAGGLSAVRKDRQIALLAAGYMISRTLYGMAFVWFAEAGKDREKGKRGDGSLSPAVRKTLRMILSVILALCFCTCVVIEPIMGMLEALLSMWVWTYYYYMSKKVFGGVTEESAGYFLTLCELALSLFVGMFGRALL